MHDSISACFALFLTSVFVLFVFASEIVLTLCALMAISMDGKTTELTA